MTRYTDQSFQGSGRFGEDEETSRRLFERYYVPVTSFFAGRGFPAEERLDLTQETFHRAYRGAARFGREGTFETWLFRIGRNVYRNRLRSAGKGEGTDAPLGELLHPDEASSSEDKAEVRRRGEGEVVVADSLASLLLDRGVHHEPVVEDQLRLVIKAVAELPPRLGRCMVLSIQGMTSREIADAMQIPVNAVFTLHRRAWERLRKKLAHGDRGESLDAEIERAWNRVRPHPKHGSEKSRPLASLLVEGTLPSAEALEIALEISRSLTELHSGGRVLHDLRAETVLISPSGRVQLLDLGFAPTPESFEVGYGRPAEDVVIDLYRSISPEQVVAERLDQRSNLFSLGVLLYEMFAGVSPFRDSTPLDTASRILALDPPPLSELNPEVESALSVLIHRLLAKEPEDRPPSAAAVTRELESIVAGLDASASRAQSAEPLDVESQIERLYDEIIALSREKPAADGPNRDEEIERAYARLLELQMAEAEQFRERFEASLNMPIDAGERILARVAALKEELEDLASSDPATPDIDDAQTSPKAL